MSLLNLSREFQFGLIEDDWGSDMLSYSEFRPPLRSLGGDSVLYVNSFTKKLLPSLRIGFLLCNPRIRDALLVAKHVAMLGNPSLTEVALYEFLDRGYYDTHLRTLQTELDSRYHACLAALQALMPADVRWTTPGGEPILWLEIPRDVDLDALAERLTKRQVSLEARTGNWFFGVPHFGLKTGEKVGQWRQKKCASNCSLVHGGARPCPGVGFWALCKWIWRKEYG